jgi:hypothetical protein
MLASGTAYIIAHEVKKMDYIDYGIVLKVETVITKTSTISNHLY